MFYNLRGGRSIAGKGLIRLYFINGTLAMNIQLEKSPVE